MAFPLRQSTASQEIPLGPFVDSTDGNTQETALTIANTDIKIWKSGGTTEASKNSGGATHIANGHYYAVLDATDTDTLGQLRVRCHPTGALVYWLDCEVLPAHVYDSLYTANGPRPIFGIIDDGTAQAVAATTITLRSGFSATDDVIIGATVYVYSSTNGLHERAIIRDWVNSTKVATIDGWTAQTPSGTILYSVFASVPQSTSDLASIRTAVGLASANVDTQLSTIDTVVDAVQAKTDNLPVTIKKNVALSNFVFPMRTTGGAVGTGLTVTVQISKDGGAFATVAGAVTEISGGFYKVAMTQTEMNADVIAVKCTATGAAQRDYVLYTDT